GLPTETTTEAITSVLVRDGATMVLGGLLKERREEQHSGLPGLGNMPLLGGLFRRRQVTKSKTEIVVLITPHIMREDQPAVAMTPEPTKLREGAVMWDADFVLALSNAL